MLNRPARMVDQVNWFHAQGSSVVVAWNVTPKTIPEDGELTATLTITGATNPRRILRPDLKKLPEFETRFVIADNADPQPAENAQAVSFSYRLRPRNRSVNKVPALEFYYYNPAAPERSQFKSTKAQAVEIAVTEVPKREPPPVPLAEPDSLFVIAKGPQVLSSEPFHPSWWAWLMVGLGGPLTATVWYGVWRWVYPDAARLSVRRRSRAARRAIEAIRKSLKTPDPPAAVGSALLTYFRSHYPLPLAVATPGELEAALAELGVAEADREAAGSFLRACDAARFAPGDQENESLIAKAEALVGQFEAARQPLDPRTRAFTS